MRRGVRSGVQAIARRAVRPGLVLAASLLAASTPRAFATEVEATPPFLAPQRFAVGSAAPGGLSVLDMARDGTLEAHSVLRDTAIDHVVPAPDGRFLYISEPAASGGIARIASLGLGSDAATILNHLPVRTSGSISLQMSPDGQALLVSNAAGERDQSGLALFALQADGRLGRRRQFVPYPDDKAAPAGGHAGEAIFAPDGKAVFVAMHGSDTLRAFRYDHIAVSLTRQADADLIFPHGSSPRHLLFAPNGRHAYAVSATAPTLFVLDNAGGRLALAQTVSLAEPNRSDAILDVAPVITPDGRTLYLATTGARIAALHLDADGRASLIGRYPTGGGAPGALVSDMIGARLLVTDEASDRVDELPIDRNTGALEPARIAPLPLPRPIAISAIR